MLEVLLGSVDRERVLIYIFSRSEGYAREMARFFDTNLLGIQRQLEKLEAGGVLASRQAGRTRLYTFDPRYPFLPELMALLEKVVAFYSEEVREELLMSRKRPRRKDKPL